MSSSSLQPSSEIRRLTPLVQRGAALRGDVAWFVPLYALLLAWLLARRAAAQVGEWQLDVLAAVALVLLQILTHLMTYWSLTAARLLLYTRAADLSHASHILVEPVAAQHRSAIVALQLLPTTTAAALPPSIAATHWLTYRQLVYWLSWSAAEKKVQCWPRLYPVTKTPAEYLSSKGVPDAATVQVQEAVFGLNDLVIEMPSYGELLRQQVAAPLFVFQTFCIALYTAEGQVMMSLFTLFMLLVVENITVRQRLHNLSELHAMRPPVREVQVYRFQRWNKIASTNLLPGDIVSLARSHTETEDVPVPCDMLLLSGHCLINEAMLTGEAVPQPKEALSNLDKAEAQQPLNALSGLQHHMLYAGTSVVQASPASKEQGGSMRAPDKGCLCYVLRTGFATQRGSLVRAILSTTTDTQSANNKESALFFAFLLLFAVAAAVYTWNEGIAMGKARYKLIIECLLVMASVIPPELPLQLSLAIITAMNVLRKPTTAITCTEPFRIPMAGRADVVCFDKTGTLTKDKVKFEGFVPYSSASAEPAAILQPAQVAASHPECARALGTCHALNLIDNELIGDPLEAAVLEGVQWKVTKSGTVVSTTGMRQYVTPLHRYQFNSTVKRMSVVQSVVTDEKKSGFGEIVTKGAPEVIGDLLAAKPPNYDQLHRDLARRGKRVLAVASRKLDSNPSAGQASVMTRADAERDLALLGFLVLATPLKADTSKNIRRLTSSSHYVIMITGDSALTAAHVAVEVGMCTLPVIIAEASEADKSRIQWRMPNDSLEPWSRYAIPSLAKQYTLGMTGEVVELLQAAALLNSLVPYFQVYARVTPAQKAVVVEAYDKLGLNTVMCGDGTNDVGALQAAHVGIALMAGGRPIPETLAAKGGKNKTPKLTVADQLAALQQEQSNIPKLGDASMAAPFTSRNSSIRCVVDLVRQGRATLAIATQMMHIMALNCLINSYSLSVIYSSGVRIGDTQMTSNGLCIAACMFFISQRAAAENLSSLRPRASAITPYLFASSLLQFGLHIACMVWLLRLVTREFPLPQYDPKAELEFAPSVVNTVVFLMLVPMQASTYISTMRGAPFLQGLLKSKALLLLLASMIALPIFYILGWLSKDLSDFMGMVAVPASLKMPLLAAIAGDVVGAFILDRLAGLVFGLPRTLGILRWRR